MLPAESAAATPSRRTSGCDSGSRNGTAPGTAASRTTIAAERPARQEGRRAAPRGEVVAPGDCEPHVAGRERRRDAVEENLRAPQRVEEREGAGRGCQQDDDRRRNEPPRPAPVERDQGD